MDIVELASGLRFPEGPIAMGDGSVLLVEIERQTLTRVDPDGYVSVVASIPGGPNGAAIGPDGKIYICNNGGFEWIEGPATGLRPHGTPNQYTGGRIERVDMATGQVETLYEACDGVPLRGPNDIVFDRQGGFWFTDLGKTRAYDMDRGAVFYAAADGSLIRRVIFPMFFPNGIGLSPEEDRLYVAETHTGRVWAFNIEAPGQVAPIPFPSSPNGGELIYSPAGYQLFDSLAVDGAGNVCVATLYNGGISVVAPGNGNVKHVPMPDPITTNICFGGPDLRKAFITLSSTGRLVTCDWDTPGLHLNFQDRRG